MRIVLTGGPSAGKTTVADTLARAYFDRLILVPEAASMLYRGGFPREEILPAVICQQRAIYHVQKELEEIKTITAGQRSQICDRGTLDGLAYWPTSQEDFFKHIGSSMDQEVARYAWVIHLDTASELSYQASTIRKETYKEAQEINKRIKDAWAQHPRRILIPNNSNFSRKITLALTAVRLILEGAQDDDVRSVMLE